MANVGRTRGAPPPLLWLQDGSSLCSADEAQRLCPPLTCLCLEVTLTKDQTKPVKTRRGSQGHRTLRYRWAPEPGLQ